MLVSISPLIPKELETQDTSIEFDGLLEVTPVHQNVVTKRPLEDGFDLNDAIHNEAIVLNVSIIITDNAQSLGDTRNFTNLASNFLPSSILGQVKKQLTRMKYVSDNALTITFTSKYARYRNYFLENFTYTETSNTSIVLNFTLSENRSNEIDNNTTSFSETIGVFS